LDIKLSAGPLHFLEGAAAVFGTDTGNCVDHDCDPQGGVAGTARS
jgi:hypothetical protein